MKTRNGFVSNSSSSSFIAFGLHVPDVTVDLIMTMFLMSGLTEPDIMVRLDTYAAQAYKSTKEHMQSLRKKYNENQIDLRGYIQSCFDDDEEMAYDSDWMDIVFKDTVMDGLGYRTLEETIGKSSDSTMVGYCKTLGEDGLYGVNAFSDLTDRLNMGKGLEGLQKLGKELDQVPELYIGTIYN